MKFNLYSLVFLGILSLQNIYAENTKKIKRGSSVFNIGKINETAKEERVGFSTTDFWEYIKVADNFFKSNDCNGINDGPYQKHLAMYESYYNSIQTLKDLGRRFGYKKHPAAPDEIIAIDLSCPNIRRICLEKINSNSGNMNKFFDGLNESAGQNESNNPSSDDLEKNAKTEFFQQNASMEDRDECWQLYKILRASEKIFKQIESSVDGNVDIPKSLVDTVFDTTLKYLFDVSDLEKASNDKYKKEEFEKDLRELISNFSGFQRIMALVSGYLTEFSRSRFSKITVGTTDEVSHAKQQGVFMKSSSSGTLFHELGHVFHVRLGINLLDKDKGIFENFSVVNSPKIDLVDRVFPLLKKDVMDDFIAKIKETLKQLQNNGDDFIKIHFDKIKKIAKRTVAFGFGKILFGDGGSLNVEDRLKDKGKFDFIAKCIYLDAVVLGEAYLKEAAATKASYKMGSNRSWNSFEELLTIQGLVFFIINGKHFVIEDRQESHIFKMRKDKQKNPQNLSNEDGLKIENKKYNSHSRIEEKLSEIKDELRDFLYEAKETPLLIDPVRKPDDDFSKKIKPSKEKYKYTEEDMERIRAYRQNEKDAFYVEAEKFLYLPNELGRRSFSNYSVSAYNELTEDLKNDKVFLDNDKDNISNLTSVLRRIEKEIPNNMENLNNLIRLCNQAPHNNRLLLSSAEQVQSSRLLEEILKNNNFYIDATTCLLDATNISQGKLRRLTQEKSTKILAQEKSTKRVIRRKFVKTLKTRIQEEPTKILVQAYLKRATGYEEIKLNHLDEFWALIGKVGDEETNQLVCNLFLKENKNLDIQRFLAFTHLRHKLNDGNNKDNIIAWFKPILNDEKKDQRILDLIKLKDQFEKSKEEATSDLVELLAEIDENIPWIILQKNDFNTENVYKIIAKKWKTDYSQKDEKFTQFLDAALKKNGIDLWRQLVTIIGIKIGKIPSNSNSHFAKFASREDEELYRLLDIVLEKNDVEFLEKFTNFIDTGKNASHIYSEKIERLAIDVLCFIMRSEQLQEKIISKLKLFNEVKPEIFAEGMGWPFWIYLQKVVDVPCYNELELLFIDNVKKVPERILESALYNSNCVSVSDKLKIIENYLQNGTREEFKTILRNIVGNYGVDMFLEYIQLRNADFGGKNLEDLFIKNAAELSEKLSKSKISPYQMAAIENYLKNGKSDGIKNILSSIKIDNQQNK